MPSSLRRRHTVWRLITCPPTHCLDVAAAVWNLRRRWTVLIARSSAAVVTLGRPERGKSFTEPVSRLFLASLSMVLRCTPKWCATSTAFVEAFLNIPTASFLWSIVNRAILSWLFAWCLTITHNKMLLNQAHVITHKLRHISLHIILIDFNCLKSLISKHIGSKVPILRVK